MLAPIGFTQQITKNRSFPNRQPTSVRQSSVFDTVSFCSDNLLAKSSKDISKIVQNTVNNEENFIGSGTEGNVYRIGETGYCVKVFHKDDKNFGKWELDIKDHDKVNHVVAKAENNAIIMKYIDGIPLFKVDKFRVIDNLPLKSIKDLILQVSHANDEGMMYDGASSNVIYNPVSKSLTAIDFYPDYIDEINTARPLTQVFTTLSIMFSSDEANSVNRRLGGKMLNIVVDELEKDQPGKFPVYKDDVNHLLNKIKYSQDFNTPPQYRFLEESINKMLDYRLRSGNGEDVKKELDWESKFSKCLIKQCLS